MYENHTQYYTMAQLHDFIKTAIAANKKVVKERNSGYVYSIPAAFDIETTSIYDVQGEKCGIMYLWGFGINGYVIIGRTWDDFILLYDCIVEMLETVGYGYLMGNAPEQLQNRIGLHTSDNDHDGICKALLEMGWI